MGTDFNITADSNGKILDVLNQQILRRVQVLGLTTKQACIAIAIGVSKSLRASTNQSNGQLKPFVEEVLNDLDISVKECNNLFVSFKSESGIKKPCVREGSKYDKKAPVTNKIVLWHVERNNDLYKAKVYKITLSDSRKIAWNKDRTEYYIVCKNLEHAINATRKRYLNIVKYDSKLGKNAWSRAMMLTSDRALNINTNNLNRLNNSVVVDKIDSTNGFTVHVENNLSYADKSLKGGLTAINTAMMKALNSTNGYINSWINKHDPNNWFNEHTDTPFPSEAFQ